MPYSFVIELYSQNEIRESHLVPRIQYALALNIIRTVEPALSAYLHDQSSNKSITLRTLWHKNNFLTLRLTLLDDILFEKFATVLIDACIPVFPLNDIAVKISKITSSNESENFWAGYKPYKEIYENASHENLSFRFNLITPVCFKKGDSYMPFPLPDLFFKSLHKRWNEYSEIKFDDSLTELFEKHIAANNFQLETKYLTDKNIKFTGATGKVNFKITGKPPKEFIHYINTLADYVYFAGVGIKTTMGMGQVVRVDTGGGQSSTADTRPAATACPEP